MKLAGVFCIILYIDITCTPLNVVCLILRCLRCINISERCTCSFLRGVYAACTFLPTCARFYVEHLISSTVVNGTT